MAFNKFTLSVSLSVLAMALSNASAQEVEERQSVQDTVVVVGALTDIDINSEDLELFQAASLTDVFRSVPSVSVGGGVGLAQKIYIRGLEDTMINVTIDGAPQGGTLFHHIGRVNIEPELLEQVQVQTGASEATFGFGAIAGAIRFKTKNANDLLEEDKSFGGKVKATYLSNDGYKGSASLYGRITDEIGIIGTYVYSDAENYKDGNGDEVYGTGASQELGFVKLSGDFDNGHSFSLSYEHRQEEADLGERPNWPVLADSLLFESEGTRGTAVANYGYETEAGNAVQLTGFWSNTEFFQGRTNRWGEYGAEIETIGFDIRSILNLGGHDIVAGFEHHQDKVSGQYLADYETWSAWSWDPNTGYFEEQGSLFGAYIQDKWRPFEKLLLTAGARFDSYDLDMETYDESTRSDGFSFNGGLDYALLDGLNFNIGYAEAFRGKEIGDGFTLERGPNRLRLHPDLQPETVGNFETGFVYTKGGFKGSIAYYDMQIDNVIFDQIGSSSFAEDSIYAGLRQDSFFYDNIGTYDSTGVEVRAEYRTGPFYVSAFYNQNDSELNGRKIEGYEEVGLGTSVGDNWNLTAGFIPNDRLSFQASLTQYLDLNDIETLYRAVELGWIDETQFVDKPGYTVVDLFATWQPFETEMVELSAAVYNLFDEQYLAHASVADYNHIAGWEGVSGVAERGRDIRVTAALKF